VSAPAEPVAVCSEWWCVSTSRASSTSILYCVLEEQTNGSLHQILYLLKVHSAINISHLPILRTTISSDSCESLLYQTRSFLCKSTLSQRTTLNQSINQSQFAINWTFLPISAASDMIAYLQNSSMWFCSFCDGQSRFNAYTQCGLAIQFTEHVNLHYT
jgi:hypothetical protein